MEKPPPSQGPDPTGKCWWEGAALLILRGKRNGKKNVYPNVVTVITSACRLPALPSIILGKAVLLKLEHRCGFQSYAPFHVPFVSEGTVLLIALGGSNFCHWAEERKGYPSFTCDFQEENKKMPRQRAEHLCRVRGSISGQHNCPQHWNPCVKHFLAGDYRPVGQEGITNLF